MSARLTSFPLRYRITLRVFCPTETSVVTTFEDYLPDGANIATIYPNLRPDLPARLSWGRADYDYYPYLPRDRSFDGHLLAPLKHYTPKCFLRSGQWYMDPVDCGLWVSLDAKFEKSISSVASDLSFDPGHYKPPRVTTYGFTKGYTSQEDLKSSLEISKHAFIHRLAYLTYLIARQHDGDLLYRQSWWISLRRSCGHNWADSVLDAVCRQWDSRNFVGVAVRPIPSPGSVGWLSSAFRFGVPIWVSFPHPDCYKKVDQGHIAKDWIPTQERVNEARLAEIARFTTPRVNPAQEPSNTPPPEITPDPLSEPETDPPIHSDHLSPPAVLPDKAKWYASWEEFFRKRDEADRTRTEGASDVDKERWKSRKANAQRFSLPGRGGPKVYVWEPCDSGGFFRIPQTRHEVGQNWGSYYKKALIFSPQKNTWDYCPLMWKPAAENGSPDDDDSDDDYVTEQWYAEPAEPATLPDNNRSLLEFLYQRYGFLSVEPTTLPEVTLGFNNSTACRIVGLEGTIKPSEYLNSFITSILQGGLPAGHCDLSPTSPPNERFPSSGRTLIYNTVFWSIFPGLSDQVVFAFINGPNNPQLLVVHESLSVLQMVRAETQSQLTAELRYLLHTGSRFTLLYPHTQTSDPPRFSILTFPIRDAAWKASTEDYRAYKSRLKTFFLERPHVMAAAFSRGGIAWRIAREVLGIEDSAEAVLGACPDQESSSIETSRGIYWFNEPGEGEWFYLVGGYEVSTGLWFSLII